jgi:hypothetical protein
MPPTRAAQATRGRPALRFQPSTLSATYAMASLWSPRPISSGSRWGFFCRSSIAGTWRFAFVALRRRRRARCESPSRRNASSAFAYAHGRQCVSVVPLEQHGQLVVAAQLDEAGGELVADALVVVPVEPQHFMVVLDGGLALAALPQTRRQAGAGAHVRPVPRQNSFYRGRLTFSRRRRRGSHGMAHVILLPLGSVRAAFRRRSDLVLENLALRQQVAVLARRVRRPRITTVDRWFWIALRRCWSRWTEAIVFVKPETVVRWHRAGFRRYWTWLSQHGRRGRPPITVDLRGLIRRMTTENPSWGAPRVHGELLMLGFDISERTVSRLFAASALPTRSRHALAHVPPQPPRRNRRNGFLRGSDSDLSRGLCMVRD